MLQRRLPVCGAAGAAWALALAASGCLPLPVHTAPSFEGRVVDSADGRPLAGAIVVVRFDAVRSAGQPARELLGHMELTTDADGRFATGLFVRPGLALVPHVHTEARLAGVMAPGYRCPRPAVLSVSEPAHLALQRAAHDDERRATCPPIAALPRRIPRYLAAWRDLYSPSSGRGDSAPPGARDARIERLLAARRVFGFGENCEGPVLDLALAPDGERLAYLALARGGPRVFVGWSDERRAGTWVDVPGPAAPGETRRLAWTRRGELALWDPVGALEPLTPDGIPSPDGETLEIVWRPDPPAAAPAPAPDAHGLSEPRDEAYARWRGRSFAVEPVLDPSSGLPIDRLSVSGPGAGSRVFELPGEACGAAARFGRPYERIAADGRTALDLRFVDGGCHVVATDLEDGRSRRVDRQEGRARCTESRWLPPNRIATALVGYVAEIESALERAGADPSAPYALRVARDGRAEALSRSLRGDRVRATLPAFPVDTPLRRIEVSLVGGGAPQGEPATSLDPL